VSEQSLYTATGFPKVFYLAYHLYRHYFPLLALATYRRAVDTASRNGA
jgi:squalene-hopene/tetraprenyl-beta-curcumene cyclase